MILASDSERLESLRDDLLRTGCKAEHDDDIPEASLLPSRMYVKEGSELFPGLSQPAAAAVPKVCFEAKEPGLDDLPHVTKWLISILSSAHL